VTSLIQKPLEVYAISEIISKLSVTIRNLRKTTLNYFVPSFNTLAYYIKCSTPKQDSILTDPIHIAIKQITEQWKYGMSFKNVLLILTKFSNNIRLILTKFY
jgi:hypothetical protein